MDWTIERYQLRDGQVLMSPAYPNNGRIWCLQLEQRTGSIALRIGLVSSPTLPVLANYMFLRSKQSDKTQYAVTGLTAVLLFQEVNAYRGSENLFHISNISQHLENGCLKLHCVVNIFNDKPFTNTFVPQNDLKTDFGIGSLLDIGHFDVTLVAGEKEFRAHKLILSGRSPIFAKMFEHDMKEKSTNTVEIDDIEPEILEEMITYIYTGDTPLLNTPKTQAITAPKEAANDAVTSTTSQETVNKATATQANETVDREEAKSASAVESPPPPPNPREVAKKLLYAADKYQIEGLVKCCEKVLYEYISVDNAAEMLLLAIG